MQRALGPVPVTRSSAILPIEGSRLVYERAGRRLIDNVDAALGAEPRTLAIMGPNGAGKSLLLRLLVGLLTPDSGTVRWAGRPPDRARAHKIGFVFQKPILLRRSALANIAYALEVAGFARSERRRRAEESLARASLEHLAGAPARLLSGGEQQRLSIARAFSTQPEILILDEPTSNLDPASTAAIEGLLQAVRTAGTRIVIVTHNLGQARRLADEIMFLHRGRLLEQTPTDRFFSAPGTPQAKAFIEGELVL